MFAIPTNRLVLPAAQSLLTEMNAMRKRGGEPEELLILDNGPQEVAARNKRDLAWLQQSTPYRIIHHDLGDMQQWIEELAVQGGWDLAELKRLLYPEPGECDYGKMFNMLYLAAARYGRKTIHRRDSDCFAPQGDESLYPVVGEMAFLGRMAGSVLPSVDTREADAIRWSDEEIGIAGSDYTGNWNVNLELLQAGNAETLNRFLRILCIPESRIPAYIAAKYSENEDTLRTRPLLITCETVPDMPEIVPEYPECGNIAMKGIFEWIPNFIGSRCIGFDYHTFILGALLKMPAVYHTNRIVHRHDTSRKQDATFAYWKGIVKLADYNRFITDFRYRQLPRLAPPGVNGLKAIQQQGTGQLADLLFECHESMNKEARLGGIYQLIDEILLPSALSEYHAIAEQLASQAHALIDELDDDYRRSIRLQQIWRELITVSARLGTSHVQV